MLLICTEIAERSQIWGSVWGQLGWAVLFGKIFINTIISMVGILKRPQMKHCVYEGAFVWIQEE